MRTHPRYQIVNSVFNFKHIVSPRSDIRMIPLEIVKGLKVRGSG